MYFLSSKNVYYQGGGIFGLNDYAFIEDFRSGQDKFQLKRDNYVFGRNFIALQKGVIFNKFGSVAAGAARGRGRSALIVHLLLRRHCRLFLLRESGAPVVERLHGRTVRVGEIVRGELVERAPQEVHRVAHVSELHFVPVRQWNVGRAEVQMPPSG